MNIRQYNRERKKAAKKRKQEKADMIARAEKLLVAKLIYGCGLDIQDKYYYRVVLLLIATGMNLKDLLEITIEEAEINNFLTAFPLVDPDWLKWLQKQSKKHDCPYLLYIRCRKSYEYYFKKLMRKSGFSKENKRIVPGLKGGG